MKTLATILIAIMLSMTLFAQETVQIGNQIWMKNNLNVGTMILGSQDQTSNGTIEKYCYNDAEYNCDIYGGLYQWDELMNYSTAAQGICPAGFRVPTKAEYDTLIFFLSTVGKTTNAWLTYNDAGKALKNNEPIITLTPLECYLMAGGTGTAHPATLSYYQRRPTKIIGTWNNKWGQPDERGNLVSNTNSSGFTALATGFNQRPTVPWFYGMFGNTNLWTCTVYIPPAKANSKTKSTTSTVAYMMKLGEQFNGAITQPVPKQAGLPARCIKN